MNILAVLELVNKLLDILKGVWNYFKKSPVKEYAEREKESDAAHDKSQKSDDTSGIFHH